MDRFLKLKEIAAPFASKEYNKEYPFVLTTITLLAVLEDYSAHTAIAISSDVIEMLIKYREWRST